MADPIDAAALRNWAAETNARLDALEKHLPAFEPSVPLVEGLPFIGLRQRKRPLDEAGVKARMMRNGASEEDAARWAAEVIENNRAGAERSKAAAEERAKAQARADAERAAQTAEFTGSQKLPEDVGGGLGKDHGFRHVNYNPSIVGIKEH